MPCVTITITRDDAKPAQRAALTAGAIDPSTTFVAGDEVALKGRGIGGLPVMDCRAKVRAQGGADG